MRVIGAGLPRTGTTSTQAALKRLGLRCYHMQEVPREKGHLEAWAGLLDGQPMDWRALFEGYQATVDAPACFYYEALMETWPEAKVLLNVRDRESWLESVHHLLATVDKLRPMGRMVPRVRKFIRFTDALIERHFGPRDDAAFLAAHDRHDEAVRRVVPADRLLVFQPSEGWEPLCAMLGCEVPDEPFPHLNDRADLGRRIRKLLRGG